MELARAAYHVVLARLGVVSNNPAMVSRPEYLDEAPQQARPRIWSLLSAVRGTDPAPFEDLDAILVVLDTEALPPDLSWRRDRVVAIGPFSRWEERPPDRRWTLYGNAGLFSRMAYMALERCHGMLSFHATAMYRPDSHSLYVAVGSAGAGKTILMMEACVRRGYQVFATEMTHVNFVEGRPTFHKGSLYDNVRLGNVLYDFPELREAIGLDVPADPGPDVYGRKICVSFARLQTEQDVIVDPKITLLFPRIEGERQETTVTDITSQTELRRLLFENASEMINRPRTYYGELQMTSFDDPDEAAHRAHLVRRLLERGRIVQAKSIFAGTRNSLEGVE